MHSIPIDHVRGAPRSISGSGGGGQSYQRAGAFGGNIAAQS